MSTVTRIDLRPGRSHPQVLLSQGPLRARRLQASGAAVRVALVAGQALLLAGDAVRLEVVVDGPVRLELVETSGTVAYDMRGGTASWDVDVVLRHGAALTWHAEPFVVAAGADVVRTTGLHLDDDCTLTLRESLVLGRTGESGGALQTRTRASRGGRPVLVEDLSLAPAHRAGPAVLDGRRCLDTLLTVGHRLPEGAGVLQLEEQASLARWIGDDQHLSPLGAPVERHEGAEVAAQAVSRRPASTAATAVSAPPGDATTPGQPMLGS